MAKKTQLLNSSGVIFQAPLVVPGVGADDGDSRALDKGDPADTGWAPKQPSKHEMLDIDNPMLPNVTARPYGLPERLEWSSNIILRHAQKYAQGQCFGIYQTTNPKP